MDKYIGKMLDNRYEILEIIGRGGMAVVYKAKCHRLNRFVAVKILKEELAQDEEFRQRFRDESQTVAMLSHPNIVSVYDVSRSGDVEYIVMELIDGGITLKDYLAKKGPLNWKETVFFAMQIAKALEYAHSRGVIHRDIKPQNIMLLRDGTVKVADFGIARHVTNGNTYNMGEAIGSVHYVSPEQAKGSYIDNRSDIYSLGVVMYEMLTGRLPFEGDSPLAVALQHINSIPLLPSDYVSDIPKTLEDITMKAMSPQLSSRYASATELLSDLEHFREDQHYKVQVNRFDLDENAQGELEKTQVIPPVGARQEEPDEGTRKIPVVSGGRNDLPPQKGKGKKKISGSLMFTIAAISIFCIGAIFFIAALISPFGSSDKSKITAPKLVGRTFEDVAADTQLQEQGFQIVEEERVYDDKVPADEIISQSPKAGAAVGKDKIIKVTVSRGAKTEKLADYTNMEYRKAEIELDRLGIEYTEQWEFSKDFVKDYIISTSPGEGAEVAEGDKIVLVISKGPEVAQVDVPNLTGWSEEDARSTLVGKGLIVGKVTPVDSDKPDKTVVFQSIPAGTKVDAGTTVDLHISNNKPKEPDKPAEVSKTLDISLAEDSGNPLAPIKVTVLVDGSKVYEKEHNPSENSVSVKVTATAGKHTITIIQNGNTYEEVMEF
ncbi:Stk1 family PASTA domain-containing Ser/Thr kinase [Acidaminobacterium chupaoyuni]